ncbi:MAG: EAL domain-containing protein [Lachnospiraceae bacterium]
MKILYFDLSAILLLSIFIASMFLRKMLEGRANKLLLVIYVNVLITCILDIWSESYSIWFPVKETNSLLRYILYYGYFLSRNLTTPLYQLYLCAVTDTWHILKKKKWLQGLLVAPYLAICLLLFFNLFYHNVFYFDQNLIYTRGPHIYGLYIFAFIYFIIGIVYLLAYRKVLSVEKFLVLICLYPWNISAILVQLFVPKYLVEIFLTTLSLILISNVVQRPEEIVNPIIGIHSHVAYMSAMKKIFMLQKPVQVFLAKIVNYQSFFTVLGYDSCNSLMKQIADSLQSVFRKKDFSVDLYYLENGLFAVVSESDDSEYFKNTAQHFSDLIKGGIQMGRLELEPNACICVFSCPRDIHEYEKMLSFANTFSTYFPADSTITYLEDEYKKPNSIFQLQNEIAGIVTQAIEKRRFQMYYQPIYSVEEKSFLSAEALIRLYDEKYGYISPELFITEAEKNGTILQIGEFVLDSVCSFLAECSHTGLPVHCIELNLSMKQCMQKDLADKILYYIEKYNLKPEQINLEVTETAANTAQDIVEDNICELSKQGITFSLDDYGTGYSNISRIMSLPFQVVKIDKSMTDKVFDSKINTILKYNIRLLKEIGMEIVVEGVETEEVLKQFEEMGCDFIQGYYFSKPLPQHEFVEFIKKHRAAGIK